MLSAEQLRQSGIEVFGRRGWTSDLAAHLGVHRTTIYRWLNGVPIPSDIEALVVDLLRDYRETGVRPTTVAENLKNGA